MVSHPSIKRMCIPWCGFAGYNDDLPIPVDLNTLNFDAGGSCALYSAHYISLAKNVGAARQGNLPSVGGHYLTHMNSCVV
jgi:hypothetical protein